MIDYSPPPDMGLDIVFQDDFLLVANKPCDLLSVPGKASSHKDSLATRIQKRFPTALIVHRLDMATSGLMVLALDKMTHRELSIRFQNREVDKTYTAIVSGLINQQDSVDLPLITDWPNRPKQKVDHEQGKPSLTHYRLLDYHDEQDTSRVELTPVTGRSHQLRVHMQSIGHPILGDRLYASQDIIDKSDRLLLHATTLGFKHPATEEEMKFIAEAPF